MAGPYDRIFADVRKDLPSVPDAVVRQEIFRVLDDFTQYTNIWQETFEVDVVPDLLTYVLPEPTAGKINRLLFVWDAAHEETTPYWPMSGIVMRVPGVLQVYRRPSAATWAVLVAKRTAEPLDPANYPVIDEWIVDKYADTLGRGILARLMIEPQKPYSNPMLAKVNQAAYISGRALTRVNDMHANLYGATTFRFPQQWATVQKKGFV